jgi:DNA-3-methyladenine glycosylase II
MARFEIEAPEAFALRAASDFYAGFVPGSGMAAGDAVTLTLAFRVDATFEPVAVELRQDGHRVVGTTSASDDPARVRDQVARMLGLERGCEAWPALGRADPVVGALQREYPGFFTVAKASPYDAATWAVIAPRMGIAHAARVKMALARKHGDRVALRGRVHEVFPSPERLAKVERFEGLSDEKVARLREVARAAADGKLDAERLRELGEARSIRELQTLRGVGPWAASHIYFRGAAPADGLPRAEPRVLQGFARAYGSEVPAWEGFERAAEAWRPFRMWVCVLFSRHLARMGGWNARELAAQRAAAGRAVARSP